MFSALAKRSATSLLLTGVVAILVGVTAVAVPRVTLLTLVIMWGAYAFVDGVIQLITAFTTELPGVRGSLVLSGVLGVLAGIVVLLHPGAGVTAFSWILGFWLLVRGAQELAAAVGPHESALQRVLLVLVGLLWIAGAMVFFFAPQLSAGVVAIWAGVLAVVWGVTLVVIGVRAHRGSRHLQEAGL